MPYTFLIVDDSPAMRRVLRRVLELTGAEVGLWLEAGDGLEALELLGLHPVHLIVSDINMPRMNGEELLRAVRATPALAGTPFLVVSTDGSPARVHAMLDQGASGYLAKPFQPIELAEQIQQLLGEPADALL